MENDQIKFVEEVQNESMENQQLSNSCFPVVATNPNKLSNVTWCLDGDSQLLLDEIDINSADMLQLSTTEKHTIQDRVKSVTDSNCSLKLQNDEYDNITYNVSSLYRPQQTLQELTQFTENIRTEVKQSLNGFESDEEMTSSVSGKRIL